MWGHSTSRIRAASLLVSTALCASAVHAQTPGGPPSPQASGEEDSRAGAANTLEKRVDDLTREVHDLKELVRQLQDQLSRQSAPVTPVTPATAAQSVPPVPDTAKVAAQPPVGGTSATAPKGAAQKVTADFLRDMTVNALLDGYYEYNFNSPVGRVNSLRAYDVSSNSFSLNQADLVVESAADPDAGKRLGMRIDLQFGQATSTLQGNPNNELRPEVYRDIFQAYGTYVFPVAKGLTVDFGKWASSLGIEGNYTKDQLNYSRSFWFDLLPFYHMGVRTKLAISDQVAFTAWITNGTEQTEAFNNYKDWLLGAILTPVPAVNWTLNYYQGQEHPDVAYLQNPTTQQQQTLPNEQGTYILPIANAPDGKLKIFDSYATWQALQALTFAAEADYLQERLYSYSSPQRAEGGALYAGYQLSSALAFAARVEYLADIGGLFSGTTQYLKEATFTFDYRPTEGFLIRTEFRRDTSSRHYFFGHTLDDPSSSQPTLGVGLVWWLGQKEGTW